MKQSTYMVPVTHSEFGPGKRVTDHLACGHVVVARGAAKKRRCFACIQDAALKAAEPVPVPRELELRGSWLSRFFGWVKA